MENGSNPKLRAVCLEIESILKKNDVMGAVIVADGEGKGEYSLNFVQPTWSQFELSEKNGTIMFKGRFKDPEESIKTNKTVNALWIIKDLLAVKAFECKHLAGQLKEKFKIEEDNNTKFYREDGTIENGVSVKSEG